VCCQTFERHKKKMAASKAGHTVAVDEEWPWEGGLAGYDSEDEKRLKRWIAARKREARAQKKREAAEKKRKRFEADLAAAYAVVSQLEAGGYADAGEPAPKKRDTAKSGAK
jgi:hypothetical protein